MRHIVICGLSGFKVFFYIISQTARFFEKFTEKMYILIFSTILILRRIQRDIIVNVIKSPCKVPVILVIF